MNALVMGGGGPVGASWTAALLHGLISAGLPVAESDVVLGTSAGSVVGAWLTMRPDDLLEVPLRMRARAEWHAAKRKSEGDAGLLQRMARPSGRDVEAARSIARAAIAAMPPISADQAETWWQPALPEGPWSPRLRVAAVNADTGLVYAWSSEDGISLPVAVSCSTAAPGAAPPVAVAGSVWVDGGVRSGTNADLVAEFGTPSHVLIVAPMPSDDIKREEAALIERGCRVRVIVAEPFHRGPGDLLDPSFVDVAADNGASQARGAAADLVTWWHD